MKASDLRRFLQLLERYIPLPRGRHHAITYCQYGSDETGWRDELGLHVWLPSDQGVRTVFLDDADFEKTPEELACEVLRTVEKDLQS